jgi:hypothetical protein
MENDPMLTSSPVAEAPKKARRPASKSTARQGDKAIKTAVHLSPESMRRLAITSVMEGRTQSDLVDELIRLHLRKYVVQTRDRSGSEEIAGQAMQEVSAAA